MRAECLQRETCTASAALNEKRLSFVFEARAILVCNRNCAVVLLATLAALIAEGK